MKDKQRREYAKINELQAGDIITVDGDFTCLKPWSQHTIKYDDAEEFHYIECSEGQHGLGRQLANDGKSLIGVYKGEVQP